MTDSRMKIPEPRFYPSYPMKVDLEQWRAISQGERMARGLAYSAQIQVLLFERIEVVHAGWSHKQHEMMFFKLRYAGEHFEPFAKAKIERGDWATAEVEAVRATPIPESRQASEKYTAISHPELDYANNIWPSPAERANFTPTL